jgi:hypothetical protein
LGKSKLLILFLVTLAFTVFANFLLAEDNHKISYLAELSFDNLSFDRFLGYDVLILDNGDWLADLGKPMLPAKELRIALPGGMEVKRVYVTETQIQDIEGEYNIFPAQPPIRIGASDTNFVEPDEKIYNSTQPYPSGIVEFVRQSDLAGQSIAHIAIYPVQYLPAERKVVFHSSLNLIIEGVEGYQCGDYLSPNVSEKNTKIYEKMIRDMVVNPEDVKLKRASISGETSTLPAGLIDHVVITSSSYTTYYQNLVNWHTKKGIKDTVITTSWIYANYSGSTNQERIRNFIIDANSTWGTLYFLMGGEQNIVPFYYINYYDENTPSDQYYSDFDDDWTHEVFVGRATGDNITQINTFVNKVLKYEKDPPRSSYPLDVLMLGMDLDPSTHAEYLKNSIDNYIPAHFNINKVYDSHGGNHRDSFISYLNAGQNLVNHADHCYYTYMGTGDRNHGWGIYNSHVDALVNNDQLSVVVSLGCDPNGMDYNDCIAEHFVIYNPDQAGVAFTGNTRSGWGYVGDPYSLSGKLDLEWWKGLFSRGKYDLGQVLVDSKHNFSTSFPDQGLKRHCEWTFNLLGEPAMPLWTDEPDSFAVTFPPNLPLGASSFLVHVEDSTAHTPVELAYVCLWKEGEVYERGYTNASGDVSLNPSPSTMGTMHITVTKHNYIPYEDNASVISAIVFTLPATSVEESTATLNGYLQSDGGYETVCWLLWDTDSGEPYAYSESLGVIASDSEFYHELTGLVKGQLYYFNTKAVNDLGEVSGEEMTFLTKPLTPTEFTSEATSCSTIYLTWNKPESADSIIIERNDTTDWSKGEGTEIYNGSGTEFEDKGLVALIHYYYQAWSYCAEGELSHYSDDYAATDTSTLFKRGDANGDKEVTIADVVHLINYLFRSGPAPDPLESGDADCDGEVKIEDTVYLINYLFKGGPPPC